MHIDTALAKAEKVLTEALTKGDNYNVCNEKQ